MRYSNKCSNTNSGRAEKHIWELIDFGEKLLFKHGAHEPLAFFAQICLQIDEQTKAKKSGRSFNQHILR